MDREENPDVDAVLMTATQALTGQGGWPMNVFLTPQGEPFFAGTYFPPRSGPHGPSFRQVLEALWEEYAEQLRSLGVAGPWRAVPTLLWDGRFGLLTVLLAGFGRASAEVGAVMVVGGNIEGFTRTMTTAIALETSKGDLPLAIGLGLVLITIVIAINAMAWGVRRIGEIRAG